MGNRDQARQLAAEALQSYETLGMCAKQAYAHIVCANLWADDRDWTHAIQELNAAEKAMTETAAPG
jgi:hypothetical protein